MSLITKTESRGWQPYTGTRELPDTANIFLKSGNSFKVVDDNLINRLNYNPLNFPVAFERMSNAVRRMFHEMTQSQGSIGEFWNAWKNFTRGLLSCTFIGNGGLYLYDRLKQVCWLHPQIKDAVVAKHPTLGIAFDGKIVFSISAATFVKNLKMKKCDVKTLAGQEEAYTVFKYLWFAAEEKGLRKTPSLTTLQVANWVKRIAYKQH